MILKLIFGILSLLPIRSVCQVAVEKNSLDTLLKSMYYTDQQVRMDLTDYYNAKNVNLSLKDSLNRRMKIVDSVNSDKLDSILTKMGWPKRMLLSDTGYSGLFLTFQHAEESVKEKHFHLLSNALKSGNILPNHFALSHDRELTTKNAQQKYGTQAVYNASGKLFLLPTINGKKVLRNRRKIGLPELDDHTKQQLKNYSLSRDNNIKILVIVEDIQGAPIKDVEVILGNGFTLGKTDVNGSCKLSVPKRFIQYYILFSKPDYSTTFDRFSGNGNLFYIILTQ